MPGGTISIKNPSGATLSVNITGAGDFVLSGAGGAASFPESITADETFTTTTDGTYVLSVKYRDAEIAASPDSTISVELRAGAQYIISPTPDTVSFAPRSLTSTTTLLEDVDAAINTTDKYAGKPVWNTTTGIAYWADGPAASDTWSTAAGVATHTPV